MSVPDEAGQYSFTIYKGQPFRLACCRKVDGVPTDWTGYTGLCQVRTKPAGPAVLTTAVVSFDTDRTTGNFYLDFSEESMGPLAINASYSYDVRMTKDGAATIYPLKGSVAVSTRVSIPT